MRLALLQLARRAPLLAAVYVLLAAGVSRAENAPRPLQLNDPPAPLAAAARTEAQQDRVDALAHYATARTCQQRGDVVLALRHYARAARLDPASRAARSALVALAVEHKRYALAARYAVKGIDAQLVGEEDLEILGDYWVKEGEIARAIDCYERSLLCTPDPGESEFVHQAEGVSVRLELGRLDSLLGKFAQAAEQFSRVRDVLDHPDRFGIRPEAVKNLLKVDPGALYEMFGEAFLMSDRFTEAEAAFRKSNALAPNQAVLDFNLGRIAARRGRAQEALAKLQPYFDRRLKVEGTAPYELLADALKKLGQQNELLDRLQKLHAADPANAPLSYFLAAEYLKQDKLDLAEPIYVELAAKGGPMAYPALAEIYRKTSRADKLLALLGQATSAVGTLEAFGPEAKPLTADAGLFRGLVAAGRKKAAAREKSDAPAFLALATLAQDRKNYDTANEFFELALKADPSKADEVLLSWGIGSLLDDRPAEAVKILRRGIDLQPKPDGNPVFQYYLASALIASDKPRAALAAARTAAKNQPDSARFAARVAWILFRAGRYEEARAAYEKLLDDFAGKSASAETEFALREARLALSSICVTLHLAAEADERLEEVLDEYPDDIEAHNDLGFLWADENRQLGRALKMIRFAVSAEPKNRAYRDSLGWVYYRLGRFAEAVTELEKAIDEKQPDGTILDHLGDACQKAGQPDKALAAWRRARDAFEKDKEPEKANKVTEKLEGTK